MLAPILLPKVVLHDGSRLLLNLIVRARGGLVDARLRFADAESRSACPATKGSGGPHPGYPRPVASVSQREELLAFRPLSPAHSLPESVLPESVQPAAMSPCTRAARSAASLRPRTRRAFGTLQRHGHDAHPGHREGEGFSQRALLRAGFIRQERLQDRVGLRVQGGFGGGPRGRGKRVGKQLPILVFSEAVGEADGHH